MRQAEAIERLTHSLRKDSAVQAIFLKGSFGRGEADEHSDIDLYVMVDKEHLALFLTKRRHHAQTYRPILLEDDIHIVAPQLIIVYDNFLHLDLFTVTIDTLNHQDEIQVLYDPQQLLHNHENSLRLDEDSLYSHAFDTVWFFFQYTKSRGRGNDIWAVEMLRQGMIHFSHVLAAHHSPERASLGLKDVSQRGNVNLTSFYERLTPARHPEAAQIYIDWLKKELPFFETIIGYDAFQTFTEKLLGRETSHSN